MNNSDVVSLLRNPLAQSRREGDFVRLVLAEAAMYGMPGKVITLLDDVAALLGMYQPLAKTQAEHISGAQINWRTHPNQISFDRIHEVERLVFKQRALLAFGGLSPGHMVGTAEICVAMGNLHKDFAPAEYYEIFTWASMDVLRILTGETPEQIMKQPGKTRWKVIPDEDVLVPGGRLYETYQTVATTIRREAIKVIENDVDNPRQYLRPVAAMFLESHMKTRTEAKAEGLTGVVERIDTAVATIKRMFPELKDMDTEIHDRQVDEVRAFVAEHI